MNIKCFIKVSFDRSFFILQNFWYILTANFLQKTGIILSWALSRPPNLVSCEHLVPHPTIRNHTRVLVSLMFKQGILM